MSTDPRAAEMEIAALPARMAQQLRVGAVACEADGSRGKCWTLTLTPEAMRVLARRLDGGAVPETVQVSVELARALRLVDRARAHERAGHAALTRMERMERSMVRAFLWAGSLTLVMQALAIAAVELGRVL